MTSGRYGRYGRRGKRGKERWGGMMKRCKDILLGHGEGEKVKRGKEGRVKG